MIKLLYICMGGSLGSLMRFFIVDLTRKSSSYHFFPYATVFINILGCLLTGLFLGYADSKGTISEEMQLFIVVGFLGAFTTFSRFGFEAFNLIKSGQICAAITYILSQVILGIGAAWLGYIMLKG